MLCCERYVRLRGACSIAWICPIGNLTNPQCDNDLGTRTIPCDRLRLQDAVNMAPGVPVETAERLLDGIARRHIAQIIGRTSNPATATVKTFVKIMVVRTSACSVILNR